MRKGLYFGPGHKVNVAECRAARVAIEALADLIERGEVPRQPIRVLGDSKLIISFLNGTFKKTNVPAIYRDLTRIREVLHGLRLRVAYRHVPR